MELSWMGNHGRVESWKNVKRAATPEKKLYTFEEIYRWSGSSNGYFLRLDTKAKRAELEEMVIARIQTLPHIKFNGFIGVKLFQ